MKITALALAALFSVTFTSHADDKDELHQTFKFADGKVTLNLDASAAPDLAGWAVKNAVPAIEEWYPKLCAALPTPGFHCSDVIVLQFKTDMNAPAYTMGHTITANPKWFRDHPGDANALVHEATHIVQAYGANGGGYGHNPVWLVEGLDDYIRWYIVEPQSHGADIGPKRAPSVKFDDSYRVTGNFLNWCVGKYGAGLIVNLNAAMREHKYSADTWVQLTGKPVEQLGDEWKQYLLTQPPRTPASAVSVPAAAPAPTPAEPAKP